MPSYNFQEEDQFKLKMPILPKAMEANTAYLSTQDFIGQFLKGYFMKILIADIENNTEDIQCVRLLDYISKHTKHLTPAC